jgi:Txe/YoeB family toxin of toxin-antitoxin system
MYDIILTRQAVKDAAKLEQAGLKAKAVLLLRIVRYNPYQNPPPYEKLQGYAKTYSRRINIQHRLVYQVLPNQDNVVDARYEGVVKIIRMWTHYE